MKKIREVLRLYYECNRSQQQIANSCCISQSTISGYLARARKADLRWPLAPEIDDRKLEDILFPVVDSGEERPLPDLSLIHRELKRKGVTLQILWEQYRTEHSSGYGYSRFCDLYRSWASKRNVWMPQVYKAGEVIFTDWAGMKVPIINPDNGSVREASIFVAVLGASSLTYAEATESEALPQWLKAHVHAFDFFGGAPEMLVPDNTKTGVTSPHRYEPELNRAYQEMAEHYGVAVIPARVRKPQDKAMVEKGVQDVERLIMAKLRYRQFFSIAELNAELHKELASFNKRPFQKLPTSRHEMYEQIEKSALHSLPSTPYSYATWEKKRVGQNYHINVRGHNYSVPYTYVKEKVDVRIGTNVIEIFYKSKRIASHVISSQQGGYTTEHTHRPRSHQKYAEWTFEKVIEESAGIGPHTTKWVKTVLNDSSRHLEQRKRTCQGVLSLLKCWGQERLESACQRALHIGGFRSKNVESILKRGLDHLPERIPSKTIYLPQNHEYVRGAQYYE